MNDPDGPASEAGIAAEVRTAWDEHRTYVYASGVLFVLSTAVGVALTAAGVELFDPQTLEELFPEESEFTVGTILSNNTIAFGVMIAGAITLGLLTLAGIVFNGLLVGYIAAPVAAEAGVGYVLLAILPHGVLELPAIFVAAGIGFRLVHLAVARVLGGRERFLTRPELRRIGLLIAVAWLAIAVAAVVEVYVTPALVEIVYGAAPGAGP